MKVCYSCKTKKPRSDFYKDRSKKDGLTPYCKECRRLKAAAQYQKNPQLAKDRAHKRRAEAGIRLDISRMGLTMEQYTNKVESQQSLCAVCGEEETYTHKGVPRRLAIDHDHSCCPKRRDICGKCVRGLLCSRCNQVLGKVGDDIELLEKMIGYLNKWNLSNTAQ